MEMFAMQNMQQKIEAGRPVSGSSRDGGFSLIEVVIALLIIMIGLLSVAAVFTFAITQNSGNKSRAQALAILQQEAEQIRSAKFNANITDPVLYGGIQAQRLVTAENGNAFFVDISV